MSPEGEEKGAAPSCSQLDAGSLCTVSYNSDQVVTIAWSTRPQTQKLPVGDGRNTDHKEYRMPTERFAQLSEHKRELILQAALEEFAAHPFSGSSTNRIVQQAGISKGSLFTYFTTKEDIYYHLLDTITEELFSHLEPQLEGLPQELFERILAYSSLEFSWHRANPLQSALLRRAFNPKEAETWKGTTERYSKETMRLFEAIYLAGDVPGPSRREETQSIIQWVLRGFNERFGQTLDPSMDPEQVQDDYEKGLRRYLKLLEEGLGQRREL